MLVQCKELGEACCVRHHSDQATVHVMNLIHSYMKDTQLGVVHALL